MRCVACGSVREQIQVFAVSINLSAAAASMKVILGLIVKPNGGSSSVHVVNMSI